ncbi:hypothetical protein SESBI_38715 [Sesbania bispinosa]|nr:hypothetical protein SESBI_38715 [Sesbania bispinosa]
MATKATIASDLGRDCSEEDKLAFKEGFNRVITLSDSMIQFMKVLEHRVNKMDERITELVARVDKFNLNLDTLVTVTNNINYEIAKSTKTECSTKMDQNIRSTDPPELEPIVNPPIKKDWPFDKQVKDGPIKSLTELSPKFVRNIIFDVSDEEEGDEMEFDPTNVKVREVTGTKKKSSPIKGQCSKDENTSHNRGRITHSNYVRRCRGSTSDDSKLSGKKLFQTPSSKSPGKGSKRFRAQDGSTNPENYAAQNHTPDRKKDGLDESTIKTLSSNILPKTMFSRFRPSNDMKLTEREVKIVAYIFSYDGDEDDILVKISDFVATRKDFVSLCPDRLVNNKDDVLEGCTTDELISKYARMWMQPYPQLKYINERHIRMRCALNLVCGEHNEYNQGLAKKLPNTVLSWSFHEARTVPLTLQQELPKEVTLRDPVGNEFPVSIEELTNRHCFTKGLPQMRAFYHVHYPLHMWYRYVGNATFSFELWPIDGEGQIDYPNPALKKEDHEQCVNQPVTTSASHDEDVTSEADEIMGVPGADLWTTTLTQAQVEGRRAVVN